MLVEHCMLLVAQHMLRVVQHMCDSVRLKLSQLPTKLKLKLKLSLAITLCVFLTSETVLKTLWNPQHVSARFEVTVDC